MAILNNLENAWDEEFSFESRSSEIKIFSESCCNGCSCQNDKEHQQGS